MISEEAENKKKNNLPKIELENKVKSPSKKQRKNVEVKVLEENEANESNKEKISKEENANKSSLKKKVNINDYFSKKGKDSLVNNQELSSSNNNNNLVNSTSNITKPKLFDINTDKTKLEIKNNESNNIEFNITSNTNLNGFLKDLDSWIAPLQEFLKSPKMEAIFNFVNKEYSLHTCYPPKNEIFSSFTFTPWNQVKVVIIGQDPYFNKGEAMGLCFSVNRGIAVPPSLKNIYKALLGESLIKTIPLHGDLSSWAKQGILMLNATLSVEAGEANSHQKTSGWESFTDFVIKTIDAKLKGVVFLLWGNFAKKKKKLLKSGNSFIIENLHPSPLSASRGDFGAIKQFSQVNEYLKQQGKEPIDWVIPK